MEYFAFGETFVEEHSNTDRTPYLYNGKELDEETGLYYYGARYYDPVTSIFVSVDPLAEKYPGLSPYVYTFNNPIRYSDPTGMEGEEGNGG
ncbi:MAG: RHS repeat-associated core domain-containing protein, partial [Cyclobacteriaceae bacterium]|nr:RHS repeat-associated core domain-containing protein [Cyclobacteriaceae bacterium]